MPDPATLYSAMFSNAWPIFIILFVILFFKSPWMKGKIGEAIVNVTNCVYRSIRTPGSVDIRTVI